MNSIHSFPFLSVAEMSNVNCRDSLKTKDVERKGKKEMGLEMSANNKDGLCSVGVWLGQI